MTFWTEIDAQLDRIEREGQTVAGVLAVLNDADAYPEVAAYVAGSRDASARALFGGGGGDRTLRESLRAAGWRVVWSEAAYFYVARNAAGELLTYCEGDVAAGVAFGAGVPA